MRSPELFLVDKTAPSHLKVTMQRLQSSSHWRMFLSPRKVCIEKRRLTAGKTGNFTNNYSYCFLVGYDGYQCLGRNGQSTGLAWFRYLEKEPGSRTEQTNTRLGGGDSNILNLLIRVHARARAHTHTRRFSSGTTGSATGPYLS
jgi:hypothetical protein